jgi:hypothetical protein
VAKVLCFDVDGVVTIESHTDHRDLAGTYVYRSPNPITKKLMQQAYDQGWTVVLYTGRREGQRRITENWLYEHGFHYHFLIMEKPYYTYFVDDRSRTLEQVGEILKDESGS